MSCKIKKGNSDKPEVSRVEFWPKVSASLGLRERQVAPFIAMSFGGFLNGIGLRLGFVGKIVGVPKIEQSMTRKECSYDQDEYKFKVSFFSEHSNQESKYFLIRNSIIDTADGSRWTMYASDKRGPSLGGCFLHYFGGGDLDGMFHGHFHFAKVN